MNAEGEGPVFGIGGLDNLSLGKMGPGLMGLIYGPVGVGKSTIGHHYLFKGASEEQNVCLITTEPPTKVARRFSGFKGYESSWVKDGYISVFRMENLLHHIGVDPHDPSRGDLHLFVVLLSQMIDSMDLRRIVIDPASVLFKKVLEEEPDLLSSVSKALIKKRSSAFFILDTGLVGGEVPVVPSPHLFDIIIRCGHDTEMNGLLNTVSIERWKGSAHSRNRYVLDISSNGIILVPRLESGGVR